MRTLVTQSRIASLIASLSVRVPEFHTTDNFGAEQTHAENIQPLALHIFRAHVHSTHSIPSRAATVACNGDTVLTSAGLGNDAALSHACGQQTLAEAVVNFVCARVQQVFALDVDARAAQMLRQTRSKLQRCGATGKILEQEIESPFERPGPCALSSYAGELEFLEWRDERLRNVTSSLQGPGSGPSRPAKVCAAVTTESLSHSISARACPTGRRALQILSVCRFYGGK